jgi:hypothetical protein
VPAAGDQAGEQHDPVPLGTLLDIDMWGQMLFEEGFDFQATCSSRSAAWTASRRPLPGSSVRRSA